jgi:hypothetical protein
VLHILLQCWTSGIGLGEISLNAPNILTTQMFQHLLTIMNENQEALLWMVGLAHIYIGYKVSQSEFYSRWREIDTLCMCESPLDPRSKSYLCLIDSNISSPSKWDVY